MITITNKKSFIASLKKAKKFISKDKFCLDHFKIVHLKSIDGKLLLYASNRFTIYRELIDCVSLDGDANISFDVKEMINFLQGVDGNSLDFQNNIPTSLSKLELDDIFPTRFSEEVEMSKDDIKKLVETGKFSFIKFAESQCILNNSFLKNILSVLDKNIKVQGNAYKPFLFSDGRASVLIAQARE